jgi:hypothetical protein
MLQTVVRTAGAVTFVTTLLATSPAVAGDSHVVVRVYDMATTNARARAAALRAAEHAIASADVRVHWRDCSRGGAAHPCRGARNAGELVIRILPTSAPGNAPELGVASIDSSGRTAVIATVYYDVVRRVSTRTGLDTEALLGRAIAHEIGHLLLGAPGHGRSGLMRPLWTDDELTQDRPGDWTFSDEESRQLRAAARRPETTQSGAADDDVAEAAGR